MAKSIQEWAEEIDWDKRVKAVCKPCWELKYCPYGPLVEEFPLKDERDEKSCRIFGHDCPVFYVAEPFTETRELRNVSRNISRVTQFRVLKRDNQICYECGESVIDNNIEFDHIIPFSKGGSSDEHNIRTLCGTCNKKRGNNYEFENLVIDATDHMRKQEDESIFSFVESIVMYGQEFYNNNGRFPSAQEVADEYSEGNLSAFEKRVEEIIYDLNLYFNHNDTIDIPKKHHQVLRIRWGFKIKYGKFPLEMLSLRSAAKGNNLPVKKLLEYEIKLFEKLGFRIKRDKHILAKWEKL